MPFMIVWPDSWSVSTANEGSSAASRARPRLIFSWSALVFGSTAISITGWGKVMVSSTTGLAISHRVSPVVVSFSPARAMMSPAKASVISCCLLACIITMRPTRSRLPLVAFRIWLPLFR